jgi:hypothetical protein
MGNIERNDFSTPDDVRRPDPTVTIEVVKLAGGEVGRYTFQPGWRWSKHVKPIVGGTSCQVNHVGYILTGVMGVETNDGETAEIGAGSVYNIPPGHDGWVIGDEPVVAVEFQGAARFGHH